MRSVAGIDQEVDGTLTYPESLMLKNFSNSSVMALKSLMRLRCRTFILRPIIDDQSGSAQVQLINEGQPVPVKPVSAAAFAQVVFDEIQNGIM